jgi:hypothetical protein
MRIVLLAAIFSATAVLTAGCGEASRSVVAPAIARGPHDGTAYPLPDDQGFAEIVNEPPVNDRRTDTTTAIAVYFLQPDGKTALAPPPTEVSIRIEMGRQKPETLALKSEPKSDDPAGASRFVSKRGPYVIEGLRGRLKATVAGKGMDREFVAGR